MREIKFRVWVRSEIPAETGLYYPNVIQMLHDGSIDKLWTDKYKFTSDTVQFELMQYTGLKDKNGVEIYEGDIIRYRAHQKGGTNNKPIKMGRTMKVVEWRHGVQYTGFNISGGLFDRQDIPWEVIGNIYENPELLK